MENSVYLPNYLALKENLALKEKLRIWFKNINHTKYQRYFEEWYNNLTNNQLKWFSTHF